MTSFWSTQFHEDLLTEIFVGTDELVVRTLARRQASYLRAMLPQGVSPRSGRTSVAALCFLHGKSEVVRRLLTEPSFGLTVEHVTSWWTESAGELGQHSLVEAAVEVTSAPSLRLALQMQAPLDGAAGADEVIRLIRARVSQPKADPLVAIVHEHMLSQVLLPSEGQQTTASPVSRRRMLL